MSQQEIVRDKPSLAASMRAGTEMARTSFRRQIIGHAITAIMFALLLVLLASGLRDFFDKRDKLEHEAILIADIIGANAEAAVTFDDRIHAQQILASSSLVGYIEAAVIRKDNGEVMARRGDKSWQPDSTSSKTGKGILGKTDVVRPIRLGSEKIGEVALHIGHGALRDAFIENVLLTFLALCMAGAIAFGLLYRALRPLTQRLSMMTTTMATITANDDYELRLPEADTREAKEIAVLSSSLNTMLSEIQRHSIDLKCELEQRRLTETQLRKLSKAVENSAAGIFITDPDGWIEYANPKYLQMNGYCLDEILGYPSPLVQSDLIASSAHGDVWETLRQGCEWKGEIRSRHKNGEIFWGMLSLAVIHDDDGQIAHIVGNLDDISEHKRAEETINRLAFLDPLTTLPNRRNFAEKLPEIIIHAGRNDERVAVFYLDLDHFKEVNDTLGHSMGDNLLQTAAKRLQSVLREHDVVARMGGDEFALVIPHLSKHADAEAIARKVIEHMTTPFMLDGHELSVTASMGIAYYPEHGVEADDLLKKADIALYRAKALGRNNFQVFSFGLEEVGLARLELEAQIRHALESQTFFIEYQPKLSLKTGQLCGAEALIRWNHPTLGRLSPDKFIPLAEESRLIIPLGNWIIDEVARQQSAWRAEGMEPVPVAVNLSTMQFRNDDLPERFSEALARHSLEAELLELEITESLLMDNPERIRRQLAKLDAMGIGIAIDDFGTGYSSLSYLKTLPVDVLKIDRSFVHDLDNADDKVITQAIIALAKSLGLEVVAEGAETDDQVAMLQSLGCDVIQGYIYSRPLPAAEFGRFLRESRQLAVEVEQALQA